jgi:hypothetical protein
MKNIAQNITRYSIRENYTFILFSTTSRETVFFKSEYTSPYLSLAVALNRMQYGVSFENFEELLLPYPLVSSTKKLVGGEISESIRQ